MITILIVGKGNVATHLYTAFLKVSHIEVTQISSRKLDQISSADVTIIAVSDDVISEVSAKIKNSFVVHTSGSASIYDLENKGRKGVLYMLQTFSKDVDLDFTEVPICIEALHKAESQFLKELGYALGGKVHKVNSDQRKALHLAAVFANNFTNHIYRIAHEICEKDSAEFDILKPLIKETARKIETVSPYRAQTGPAKRGDKKTIKKQLKALDNSTHKAIYDIMTKSIKNTYGQR